MDIAKTLKVAPGRYVVAVSGGVDSVVLLDLLARLGKSAASRGLSQAVSDETLPFALRSSPWQLTVAHYDHGIREDSRTDRKLVQELASRHKLPFVYEEGRLGPDTSEDKARKARYEFLNKVKKETGAHAIITAHHQDDAVETAVHNIMRGTGRRGMSSIKSVDGIIRPLLHLPKSRLRDYALTQNLEWREDSTNSDLKFRRNYIRHVVLPKLKTASPRDYARLQQIIRRQHDLNKAIDAQLSTLLHVQPGTTILRRYDITMLPHSISRELVAHWLRQNGKSEMTRPVVERLTIALKTARPGTKFELDGTRSVHFDKKQARLISS